MKWLVLLLLCSCTAQEELKKFEREKNECIAFKKEYERVGIDVKASWFINSKIKDCKDIGVWDEKK